jgi:predicted transcriptional regulator
MDKTTFHRHLIRSFDFTEQNGKEKWTAYKFIRKLYDHFAPIYLKRIRSAIAQLRESNLESFTSYTSAENESEPPDS